MLEKLFLEMIAYYSGDPKRIQHFTKVHSYAKLIGELSGMQGEELLTLEAAAYVHDIGIKVAEEKYGSSNGRLQEQEGPAVAEEMLGRLGFAENVIERVCYLIGHHHTYTGIEGRDYQILVEADFLVNLYEDGRTDGDGGFVPENGSAGACLHLEVCHDAGKEAEGKNSGIQFQGNLLSVQQLFRKSDRRGV